MFANGFRWKPSKESYLEVWARQGIQRNTDLEENQPDTGGRAQSREGIFSIVSQMKQKFSRAELMNLGGDRPGVDYTGSAVLGGGGWAERGLGATVSGAMSFRCGFAAAGGQHQQAEEVRRRRRENFPEFARAQSAFRARPVRAAGGVAVVWRARRE